jgi:hypothetical protein
VEILARELCCQGFYRLERIALLWFARHRDALRRRWRGRA